MRWSWRIGTIAGIGIYIHATFFLLLVWAALAAYFGNGHSVAAAINSIVFIVAVFGIVVLHELGHALTARRFDIPTRDITLLPIGGLARLERMPDKPWQEFLVAIAGPAVNVLLAVLIGAYLVLRGRFSGVTGISPSEGNFLGMLFNVNVVLAVFNLLPAFPMDGGRVLRALLAMRLDYLQATQIAATVGQGMAFLFGLIGLVLPNPLLILIAVFVWLGASSETSMVQVKSVLSGIPIGQAMIREFHSLGATDPLRRAVDHILAGFQQDFPVVDDGRLVGVLTRSDLLTSLASKGQDALVGDAMQRQFETAEPGEMLDNVFTRLQNCKCRSIPVVRNGHILGIVTMENLGEYMMVQSALHHLPAPPVPQ